MVHYNDYLELEKILDAQHPESIRLNMPAHDETLFIIIHHVYELWFKQALHEVNSVREIMQKPELNDNSPELQTVGHRLSRCVTILKVLVHQVDIMETMIPMDFLDFRDMLRPASGFQSWQFKILEARLGLQFAHRHGQEYYISQLRPAQVEMIRNAEKEPSLVQLLNAWLERMPFVDLESGLGFKDGPAFKDLPVSQDVELPVFWKHYRQIYLQSLSEQEQGNKEYIDFMFLDSTKPADRTLPPRACRAALFIMLYRGYPILKLPFQLLHNLLEID